MNKTELLTAMAEASGLAKKDCDAALSAYRGSCSEVWGQGPTGWLRHL